MKKIIEKVYSISAPIGDVWDALVNPKTINKWGGGPAKMDDKVGSEFSLWGGDIHGKNIEVVNEKKLVQEWFGGDWPKPSIITFTLKSEKDKTILKLKQTDVPDDEVDDIDQGWDDYYVGPMKELLEK